MVQWWTFHRLTTFSVLLYIRHLMPILPSFDGSVCSIWRPCNSDLTLGVIIRRLNMAHLNVCNHQLTDDILFCSSFDVDEIVTWRFICLIWWSCNLQLTRHLQFLIRPFISLSWSVDDSACLVWQFCFFHFDSCEIIKWLNICGSYDDPGIFILLLIVLLFTRQYGM